MLLKVSISIHQASLSECTAPKIIISDSLHLVSSFVLPIQAAIESDNCSWLSKEENWTRNQVKLSSFISQDFP